LETLWTVANKFYLSSSSSSHWPKEASLFISAL
jgi:hypothetical protein